MTSEQARLFVALEVPANVREELAEWRQRAVAAVRNLRARQPTAESLHVTLCFLGALPVDDVGAVVAACEVAAGFARVGLRVGESLWLPPRRPRVLAVSILDDRGVLPELQSAVSEALARGGWFEPERRRFLAHVTVARTGREGLRRPPRLPAPPEIAFTGSTVALMRSHTGGSGARYERLAAVELGSA